MEEEASPKRVVVIAMDDSDYSEKAFQWYLSNMHREGDHAVLVHCVDHREAMEYSSVWMPAEPHVVAAAYNKHEDKAKKVEKKLKELLENSKIDGEVKRGNGQPGHAIVEMSHKLNARCIIMGSRGLGTIRRTVLGSVSDYVMHHADIPVFVHKH